MRIYTNNTAEALLGYSLEELLSMNIRDLYNEMTLHELNTVNVLPAEPLINIESHSNSIERASTSLEILVNHLRNFSRCSVKDDEILDLYEILSDALMHVMPWLNNRLET